jgi:hypothetical protein
MQSTSNKFSQNMTLNPQQNPHHRHIPQTNELSRFGHSVTLLNQNSAILFGGAKGLSSNYDICNDCYIFKIHENTWVKITPTGEIPCARAAHAACAISQNYLAIFGGAALNGMLAPDDLFILDLSNGENNSRWIKMKINGDSPGKRYGHTMIYYRPYLIIFGGNLGNRLTNEVYITQVEEKISNNESKDFIWGLKDHLNWVLLETKGNVPCPRMYHACALCRYGGAQNMVILFGGRTEKNVPLNDCWGLRKHRNGTWDWVLAPYQNYTPQKRFQHTISFYYNFLIVIGGRNDIDIKQIPIEIYDTESSQWESVAFFNKFRHTSWIVEDSVFTHGGFQLTDTIVAQNDIIKIDLVKLFNSNEKLKIKFDRLMEEEKKRRAILAQQNSKKVTPTLSPINGQSTNQRKPNPNKIVPTIKEKNVPMSSLMDKPHIQKYGEIAMVSNNKDDKLIIRPVQFDENWGIKSITNSSEKPLCDRFLDYLLRPDEWLREDNEEAKEKFKFSIEEVAQLTKQCLDIVASQPNILKVSAPVKVFGDIHGQYIDLMNFFDKWGCPSESISGDIMSNDYLFLGDYVDRGNLSLETICLLMALKVKYPDQIHLLRGNHEDILINSGFGFQEECERRLEDNSDENDSLFFFY